MANRREKGKIPHQEWPSIRKRYAAGESLASIARDYGCTGPAIRYIVNRPVEADGLAPSAAKPARRPAAASPTPGSPTAESTLADGPAALRLDPASAVQALVGGHRDDAPGAVAFDPELRWRVTSEIASFLTVFDSFLTENSPESYDQLLGATDRLMRVAARTRIELERARSSEHTRLREGRPAASRVIAS